MAFNKKFFTTGGIVASSGACFTENVNPFTGTSNDNGKALYSMDYDASDASGLYNGTPTNVDFGVSGKTLNGARFNGSSSIIRLADNSFKNTTFTISLWAKSSDWTQTNATLFNAYDNDGTNGGAAFGINADKISVIGNGGTTSPATRNGSTSLTDNTWAHLVYVVDGSSCKTFLNNVEEQDFTFTGGSLAYRTNHNFGIGAREVGSNTYGYFNGSIDQVRYFTAALDTNQISTLWNSGNGETACVHTSTTDDKDYPVINAAYYKLDNSAEDSKGTNDGTETNIEYRFGRYGQAAVFNGSSSKITRESLFDNTQVKMSASVWIKATDYSPSGNIAILDIGDNDTVLAQNRIFISGSSPHNIFVSVNGGDGGFAQVSQSFSNNNWNHIVATWDVTGGGVTNGIKIYLNGSLAGQGNSTQGFNSARDLALGVNEDQSVGDRHHFSGSIDQVRIFADELSPANVTSLYNEKPETDTSNFKAVLYKGTAANQYISNVGMDLETDGGLVWLKARDGSGRDHRLFDSVRGATKGLYSNLQNIEFTESGVDSFEKNGFFLGSAAGINANNESFVSWVWKGGGTPVSTNNNGDAQITADVSANTAAGFSIVKYTGSGTVNQTVYHGLNQAPELIINKQTGAVENWFVFTTVIDGSNDFIVLNDSAGKGDSTLSLPTTDYIYSRTSGTMINYCFHSVAGYQKIGSYLGDGSTSGKIIYTTDNGQSGGSNGFKPSFLMIKRITNSSTGGDWVIYDNRRDTTNPNTAVLAANKNSNEAAFSSGYDIDFLSNGFELKASGYAINNSETYLYMAIK